MKILVAAGGDVAPDNDPDLIVWNGEGKMPSSQILEHRGVEGVIVGDEIWDRWLIRKMSPYLRILARCGNGWDNIDREAAKEYNIEVTRVNGAYAGPVADSTLSMILAFARNTIKLDQWMKSGEWSRIRFPGVAMSDVTVGIIGFGAIGKEVHKRLQPFGCRVLVHRPSSDGPFSVSLEELLRESDFVTLHIKLNDETHYFIDYEELEMMKPTAYLINTSRGGLVNTEALINAIDNGIVAGAGLDVFEEEPLPEYHRLRGYAWNTILAPHNAYWSPGERESVVGEAIETAKSWITGENE